MVYSSLCRRFKTAYFILEYSSLRITMAKVRINTSTKCVVFDDYNYCNLIKEKIWWSKSRQLKPHNFLFIFLNVNKTSDYCVNIRWFSFLSNFILYRKILINLTIKNMSESDMTHLTLDGYNVRCPKKQDVKIKQVFEWYKQWEINRDWKNCPVKRGVWSFEVSASRVSLYLYENQIVYLQFVVNTDNNTYQIM